jgi:hypothetical protein
MFDIFDPMVLHTLMNYLVIGTGASILFIIMYHIGVNNDGFSKKDLLFFAAGPTVGFISTVLGMTQAEVLLYTFTVNMGITGIKEGAVKFGGFVEKQTTGIKLKDASFEEIRKELEGRPEVEE